METIVVAVIITIIWGMIPVLQKNLLNKMSYETVMVTSGLLYFTGLMIYWWANKKRVQIRDISKEHIMIFLIIMLTSILSTILYYYILSKNHSSYITIITSMYPIITVIFANILLGEVVNVKLLALMSIIIMGIIIAKE